MKILFLLLMVPVLFGCKSTAEYEAPDTPVIVKVPVDRYIDLPAWATRQLPLGTPKANTPEEATRLACERRGTLLYANCRAELTLSLQAGEAVEPKVCDKWLVQECEIK